MGQRTQHEPGTLSWADLSTTDPGDAKRFYGELFGWEFDDLPVGDGVVYTMCRIGASSVAALNELQQEEREMGVPPHWNNYVTVEDVDASSARAAQLGGAVVVSPFEVMGAGRMAVIQDPTGAILCLWSAGDSIGAERVNEPGCLTWNDLVSTDAEAARDFYGGLFGWRYDKMPADDVDYWVCWNGDRTNGGLIKAPTEGMPSFWYPYFAVEEAGAAKERIESLGGSIHNGPIDVPNGRFAVAADPQGATFAVFSGDFDD